MKTCVSLRLYVSDDSRDSQSIHYTFCLEREFIHVTVPSDDYTRNHGCANYPDRDGSFPCGRYAAKQYLVISIKGAVQRS